MFKQIIVLLLLLFMAIIIYAYINKKNKRKITKLLFDRRDYLIQTIKEKLQLDVENMILSLTENMECDVDWNDDLPLPEDLLSIDTSIYTKLEKCKVIKSILLLWAVGYWLDNSTNHTSENLFTTMECVENLQVTTAVLENFASIVKKCMEGGIVTIQPDVNDVSYTNVQNLNIKPGLDGFIW